MGEVRTINGAPLEDMIRHDAVPPLVPVPGVIDVARQILDMAEAGLIIGLAGIYTYENGDTGSMWTGRRCFAMAGRIEQVKHQMIEELDGS